MTKTKEEAKAHKALIALFNSMVDKDDAYKCAEYLAMRDAQGDKERFRELMWGLYDYESMTYNCARYTFVDLAENHDIPEQEAALKAMIVEAIGEEVE